MCFFLGGRGRGRRGSFSFLPFKNLHLPSGGQISACCSLYRHQSASKCTRNKLRWLNTVCARFTDSVSDAIKRLLGLWYANTVVDKVIPQFHMKWIIKFSFDPK